MLNEIAVEADRGRFTGTSTTFGQLCERWLKLAESDLSPTTVHSYKELLRNHILPALSDVPVKNIQTIDLDQLYHGLQSRSGLSAGTVRRVHAIIRRAFRQAVMWGWVGTNPAANATQPRLTKPDLSPPNVEQVGEILRTANELGPELGHFLHLAATSGARRGELCALRWSNVDFGLRTFTIERSIVEVPSGIVEKDTKTHASRRIALDQGTLLVLEAQRDLALGRASVIGLGVENDAFVFSREPDGGIPWRPDRVTKGFAAVREELGYPDVRLHDLRHSCASLLIAMEVPLEVTAEQMGHASIRVTKDVCGHLLPGSKAKAAKAMVQMLFGEFVDVLTPRKKSLAASLAAVPVATVINIAVTRD